MHPPGRPGERKHRRDIDDRAPTLAQITGNNRAREPREGSYVQANQVFEGVGTLVCKAPTRCLRCSVDKYSDTLVVT
jgi:hypothetical protein